MSLFQRLARRLAFTKRMKNFNKGENIGKCVLWTLSGMLHIYKSVDYVKKTMIVFALLYVIGLALNAN